MRNPTPDSSDRDACLGTLAPGAMTAGIIYAPTRAEQDRLRRDHRTAQERRQAGHRVRRRCEVLTKLLTRMALQMRDPDEAAALLRRTQTAAHEIQLLVIGQRRTPPARRPQRITADALHRLDLVVEELDEAIRDVMDDKSDTLVVRSVAFDLAVVLVAGVETLAAPRSRP